MTGERELAGGPDIDEVGVDAAAVRRYEPGAAQIGAQEEHRLRDEERDGDRSHEAR